MRDPDGQDPLRAGVDVRGPFGLVQIVDCGERFPAVIDAGLAAAETVIRTGSHLRTVPLPHLVALKLYAGGTKSRADIVAQPREWIPPSAGTATGSSGGSAIDRPILYPPHAAAGGGTPERRPILR